MSLFTFLISLVTVFVLFVIVFELISETAFTRYQKHNNQSRLFWCPKCNVCYFGTPSECSKECPNCHGVNQRLTF